MRTLNETQTKQIKKEIKREQPINTIKGVMLANADVAVPTYPREDISK